VTTVNIGVSFPPASYRQRISFWSTRKVRRVLERVVDPQRFSQQGR